MRRLSLTRGVKFFLPLRFESGKAERESYQAYFGEREDKGRRLSLTRGVKFFLPLRFESGKAERESYQAYFGTVGIGGKTLTYPRTPLTRIGH